MGARGGFRIKAIEEGSSESRIFASAHGYPGEFGEQLIHRDAPRLSHLVKSALVLDHLGAPRLKQPLFFRTFHWRGGALRAHVPVLERRRGES
jgi:hypothetical protein